MICYVYRSHRKRDIYLYLAKKDGFDELPEPVLKFFGRPEFCMSFNLSPERKLAQESAAIVMLKLESDGYFLQLPKQDWELEKVEQSIIDSLGQRS